MAVGNASYSAHFISVIPYPCKMALRLISLAAFSLSAWGFDITRFDNVRLAHSFTFHCTDFCALSDCRVSSAAFVKRCILPDTARKLLGTEFYWSGGYDSPFRIPEDAIILLQR